MKIYDIRIRRYVVSLKEVKAEKEKQERTGK